MRLRDRQCDVCGRPADGLTNAQFARVVWLCREHSAAFHAPAVTAYFCDAQTTAALHARIDSFLLAAQALGGYLYVRGRWGSGDELRALPKLHLQVGGAA